MECIWPRSGDPTVATLRVTKLARGNQEHLPLKTKKPLISDLLRQWL